jgi:hypothetical protein
MRRIFKALVGGAFIPIFYFGMFTAASGIVMWTHGDDHPSLELLMMPLMWPMSVINYLFSYFYNGNVFDDFPMMAALLLIALNFSAYALLSHYVLRWYENERRLA